MQPRSQRLVQESLVRSADLFPDKVAVIDGRERVTYGVLRERANALAARLQAGGLKRGDRVALYLDNSVEAVVGVYGALLAGCAFIVINPQTKAQKLGYILSDSGAAAVLSGGRLSRTVEQVAAELPLAPLHLRMEPGWDGAQGWEDPGPAPASQPADPGLIPLDLAAIVYTSGSTGNPKGVMLSHQNVVFTQGSLVEYLRLDDSDRILCFLPLAFDYGLYQVLMSVHLGATVVLEQSFAFPAATVQRVLEEQITVFPGVPTVFATLLSLHRRSPISMPSIRRYTNTAAHLPDEYVPGLRQMSPAALVYKMYGLTECKRVCYLEPELVLEKPSSVGKAIPGTETYILREDGAEAAPGEVGVLHVRGPHVMMGYWNLPAETERMLVPGRYPGERVLCTHDYFRRDGEGFLYFVGRSDDMIKSRGEKISPTEVENALASIEGVRESAVVGVPHDVLGQALRAYVVLDAGSALTERDLKREAMARLENFMVPQEVVFLEALPKTDTGKVRKRSLLEQDWTGIVGPGVAAGSE